MRRSDGLIAVGIARCISREGFMVETKTKVGEKCILYANPEQVDEGSWKDGGDMKVTGPEVCTWGELGHHYELLYEFPDSHKYNGGIIQQRRDLRL